MLWISAALYVAAASAATWTVDPSGSGDFTTIGDAIAAASSGDRLELVAGTYSEAVDLGGKDLELVGAGSYLTTIGVLGAGTCLTATAGETLTASDLSFAGCDTLVQAAGATFEWTDVVLWGTVEVGAADAVDWTWAGGGLEYVVGTGLFVGSSTLDWSDLIIQLNEVEGTLLGFTDSSFLGTDLEVSDNYANRAVGFIDFEGGEVWLEGLEAHDNDLDHSTSRFIEADDLTTLEIIEVWFHDDGAGGRGAFEIGTSTVTSERCLFEDWTGGGVSVTESDYASLDDVHDVTGTTGNPGGVGASESDVTLEGATFLGFPSGSYSVSLRDGTQVLTGLTLEGGGIFVDTSTVLTHSTLTDTASWFYPDISDSITTISDTSFYSSGGGPALEFNSRHDAVLERVTADGDDEFLHGDATITDSSFTNLGVLSDSGRSLTITDSSIQTTRAGIMQSGGTLALDNVVIDAGTNGLDISDDAVVSLYDVTIRAAADGILMRGNDLLGIASSSIEGVDAALQFTGAHPYESEILIEDSELIASAGDAIAVDATTQPDMEVYRSSLVAAQHGISVAGSIPTVVFHDSTIDAAVNGASFSGGTAIQLYGCEVDAGALGVDDASGSRGEETTIAAGDTCSYAGTNSFTDSVLSCGAAGVVSWASTYLYGVTIEPTTECIDGGSGTLEGVVCTGGSGVRPVDHDGASVTDLLVTGFTTSEPSRIGGSATTLENLRFIGNTTSAGAGALELDGTDLVATQLHFEDNHGVDAGALVLSVDGAATLEGLVFRQNSASAGPGAVLDESGGSWACTLFQENSGTAGDMRITVNTTVLRNLSFVGSSASSTGSLHLDSSYAAVSSSIFADATAGAGIYADASFRTSFLTYNDLWGNAAGAYGGGVSSVTGANGNLEDDPRFVAYSADGDPSNDDLTLASGSPCIDAGNPSWLDDDGSVSDMGAYGSSCAGSLDYDGDGFSNAEGDCDDHEALAWTDAPEVCDGVDNDCDGLVDEADPDIVDIVGWYADADGDGYGDPAHETISCTAPAGSVGNSEDCDDSEPLAWSGAAETCDGVDNDCDGLVDDDDPDITGRSMWYRDADGDGYGDPSDHTPACSAPSGTVDNPLDCDDEDAAEYPGATWYPDADGDGFGDEAGGVVQCERVEGFLSDGTDCDDGDAGVNPGATEIVGDGVDQDCDGFDDLVMLAELAEGALVVTEIMRDPAALSDEQGSWLEIWNASGADLQLEGLSVEEPVLGLSLSVSGRLAVAADGLVVLAASDEGVDIEPDLVLEGLAFGITEGAVEIGFGDITFDRVAWSATDGFPTVEGASASLDPGWLDATENDRADRWCAASSPMPSGDRGTPGAENDACPDDTGDPGDTDAPPDTGRDSAPPEDSGLPDDKDDEPGCAALGGGALLGLPLLIALGLIRRRRG